VASGWCLVSSYDMDEDMRVKSYKDLLVWQNGIELVKQVYVMTQQFPSEEKFGLVSQMRRAGVSVPSNIAEGQARKSTAEFTQFLSITQGSLAELETQLIVSIELGFCSQGGTADLFTAIHRLQEILHSLRTKLATNH
jgi:four helix bundle protein